MTSKQRIKKVKGLSLEEHKTLHVILQNWHHRNNIEIQFVQPIQVFNSIPSEVNVGYHSAMVKDLVSLVRKLHKKLSLPRSARKGRK